MCGINGIFSYQRASSAPSPDELIMTRDAMISRGPDGAGIWSSESGRCLLGHRRLSILDLNERAAQPMSRVDGQYVVTFNGEIYNYPELRGELEAEGVIFRTETDTEVLLHMYAKWGEKMVHQLRGMFAFAIWDTQRSGLFIARDPYGIKPLYVSDDGWTFRFASQVKALIAGGKISLEKEPAGLVGFHLFGNVPEPFTLYRDVRALPAGHTQWIDRAGPREPARYHSIAQTFASNHSADESSDLQETLRLSVRESVQAHLLADVDVGLFLSGGIDSGALLGLCHELGHVGIKTITLGFDEFEGTLEDEVPLAAEVAKRYGASHFIRRVSEAEFHEDLPKILEAMDQPSIDGVNTWFVAKAASEVGLKVALSGLGSDELFAGYPSFADIPRWKRRFGPFAKVPGIGPAIRTILKTGYPDIAERNPKALAMFDYSGSWGGAYLLRRGLFMPHELAEVMDPELALEGLNRLRPVERLSRSLEPDPGSDLARVATLESSFYLRNQLLRDADWAGMAHSLEIRVPFVDRTLLEEVSAHMHGAEKGEAKGALARAPELPLPAEVAGREKTGFVVPTDKWMTKIARTKSTAIGSSKGMVSRKWSKFVLDSALAS